MDTMNTLEVGRVAKSGTVNENSDVLRVGLLGRKSYIDDVDRSQPKNGRSLLSGMDIEVRLVQSTSATALVPGKAVVWDAANVGTKVSGVAGADADAAGIVDPYITQTVEEGDYFYIYVYGPCTVTSGATLAAGATVACGASGNVVAGSGKGRMLEAATSGQLKRAFIDFRAV